MTLFQTDSLIRLLPLVGSSGIRYFFSRFAEDVKESSRVW